MLNNLMLKNRATLLRALPVTLALSLSFLTSCGAPNGPISPASTAPASTPVSGEAPTPAPTPAQPVAKAPVPAPAPTPTPTTPPTLILAQKSLSLSAGTSGTIAYSGAVQSVSLIASNLITSATLQGGALKLTAGLTAGTGTVSLSFVMQGGGTQSAAVQVTVLPQAAPSTSYVWYSGTDRAASADELEVLRLTNEVRAKGATCGTAIYPPAPALTWNDQLAHAARNHSTDMGTRSYFDHTTPEGVSFSDRITAAGFTWRVAAENIAAGYPSPQAVVNGWVASPEHCINLMNPALKELGVGSLSLPGSPYNTYWTQDFGTKH